MERESMMHRAECSPDASLSLPGECTTGSAPSAASQTAVDAWRYAGGWLFLAGSLLLIAGFSSSRDSRSPTWPPSPSGSDAGQRAEQSDIGVVAVDAKPGDTSAHGPVDNSASPFPALKIDINSAGEEELNAVPGIGPKLARSIIDFRESAGPIDRPEQLMDIPGIGPKLSAELRTLIDWPEPATDLLWSQSLNCQSQTTQSQTIQSLPGQTLAR